MSLAILIVVVAVGLVGAMSLAWAIQRATGNAGWVDVVWTFATGVGGVAYALVPTAGYEPGARSMLTAGLVTLWSLRLGLHLARRTAASGKEDARYAAFRKDWGPTFQAKLFGFLMIQALASVLLTASVLVAARNPAPAPSPLDAVGAAVLLIAILGEGVADRQLARFKGYPANRGRICDVGLWAWSRHPNYFFEWLGWLAYPILAFDPGGHWGWGWLALSGPAFMFYLLRFASGVPPTEEAMAASRGAIFDRYKARVSTFFPQAAARACRLVNLTASLIGMGERAPLPDVITRAAIGAFCERARRDLAGKSRSDHAFAAEMACLPIALSTDDANAQHYEVPTEFFRLVLGPRLKYSCCLYAGPETTLQEAEETALRETCAHADLRDGQRILELGCGWGSLSLWMAETYPNATITSVSNSRSQGAAIMSAARARGLDNLAVVTADMNAFQPEAVFDRIVSVEMFEHMANWRSLLGRARGWLVPEGRLFLHVFTHRGASYRFDANDPADWIGKHFFTGGIMPGEGLARAFPDLFAVEAEWRWNGDHYRRTAEDWLVNLDARRDRATAALEPVYGRETSLWLRRWRLFFLATAGLFGHRGGEVWGVNHYRLKPA